LEKRRLVIYVFSKKHERFMVLREMKIWSCGSRAQSPILIFVPTLP
jgi:hypothetical protein